MHYYKKNIGDYAKKAGRLSILEHGAYTLLLDACYDREQFPTMAEAIDWCWARNEAEVDAVKFVLSKFFTLEDGLYVQNRVKEELEAYHAKAEINTRIAKEREEKRKSGGSKQPKAERTVHEEARSVNEPCSTGDEPPPNQEPITNNQEPLTSKEHTVVVGIENTKSAKFDFKKYFLENGCDPQHLEDWMKVRKAKKSVNTQTALNKIIEQIEIAKISVFETVKVCAEKSWAGFGADWDRTSTTQNQSAQGQNDKWNFDDILPSSKPNIRTVSPANDTIGVLTHAN